MDPIIGGALIGGGAQLLGGALGLLGSSNANETNTRNVDATNAANVLMNQRTNDANVWMAQKANETNVQLAGENRSWQEKMANTAYQRQVADMRAAGLNPILAAMRGGGADTPAGSVATVTPARVSPVMVSPPVVTNELDYLGRGVSSAGRMAGEAVALETGRAGQESQSKVNDAARWESAARVEKLAHEIQSLVLSFENTRADTQLKLASANRALGEMGLIDANKNLAEWSARHKEQEVEESRQRIRHSQADVLKLGQDVLESKERTKYYGSSVSGQMGRIIKEGLDAVGSTGGISRWLSGAFRDHLSDSDVYRRGGGNVYGGEHSARNWSNKPFFSWDNIVHGVSPK